MSTAKPDKTFVKMTGALIHSNRCKAVEVTQSEGHLLVVKTDRRTGIKTGE